MRKMISDLREGEIVDSTYMILEKELRRFRDRDESYLRLKLGDKSGEIFAKCWEDAHYVSEKFEKGDVVRVKGTVNQYKNRLQIIFQPENISKVENFEMEDFLKATKKDTKVLFDELKKIAQSFEERFLSEVVIQVLDSREEEILKAPASKYHHYNYVGGLIEHLHSVTMIAEEVSKNFKLDRDLLLSGAILHDVGKIEIYSYLPVVDVKEEGLFEHVFIGASIVRDVISKIEKFPHKIEMKLVHEILSHHGEPKPQFPEAEALLWINFLDSDLKQFLQIYEAQKSYSRKSWSNYIKAFERFMFLK